MEGGTQFTKSIFNGFSKNLNKDKIMISEKDKKIVAAVFASRGVVVGISIEEYSHVAVYIGEHRPGSMFIKNVFYASCSTSSSSNWQYVCTIEEFNKCIEDMARAEWINDGAKRYYDSYTRNCADNGIDTSNKELLKENCDYSFYDKLKLESAVKRLEDSVVQLNEIYVGKRYLGKCNDSDMGWHEVEVLKVFDLECAVHLIEKGLLRWCDEFKPIKTPEHIKHGKLDAYLEKIVDDIAKDNQSKKWSYNRSEIAAYICTAYELGYIVEPK